MREHIALEKVLDRDSRRHEHRIRRHDVADAHVAQRARGEDVLFVEDGDICSVPFNIACGRCRMCNERKTHVCLHVNPARAGAAYGYVDMGGWQGGQAEYVFVPYADFQFLKFPDRDQALERILDLTMLSDIFPTG